MPIDFVVKKIPSKIGKEFIIKHHYSHGCHNGPMCWGLFNDETLIGVIAFATPCSENVRSSIFGPEHKSHITELHRLVILDGTPKNSESYFIARAMSQLKAQRPDIWAIISFADETQGHVGTIYQATNALYYGTTGKHRFYMDATGRLRHPRQNGKNIGLEEAIDKGWVRVMREPKHRYLFLLPNGKSHKKFMMKRLKVALQPYPKMKECGPP